ncbi:MAG: class I SAM-dependent methyltransferase [Solirubrobacterales bacterium]|nr:class I SAM-dependent methyltransferase [Solirubrobacterales bacterium]
MPELLGYESTAGMRVLDVGCGQGIDVVRYASAGADTTGVDLTADHVELARAHVSAMGLTATLLQGDAEALPFADGAFDAASSNGVRHHARTLPAALREIRRVLAPGGEARVIVYNRASAYFWLTLMFGYGLGRGLLIRERGSVEGVAAWIVERPSVGARPLVRFYSLRRPRRCSQRRDSSACAPRFASSIRRRVPDEWIVSPRLAGWLDARVGYYVIGMAESPARAAT